MSLNRHALFADLTEYYVQPAEPNAGDTVRFVFRAASGDCAQVRLIVLSGERKEMTLSGSDERFSWFAADMTVGAQPVDYFFEVQSGEETCCYARNGVVDGAEEAALRAFRVVPGFHAPDWAKGAVCYQIMVDRFRNGDLANDVRTGEYIYIDKPCRAHASWDELPGTEDYRDFYGGDLQGVLDRLDYIKQLGVDLIYFNPLFASPSSHKYDAQDYDHIDPHFGSDELFARLVGEIHRRGMRVILDGVFNHCGSFHKWMVEGAYLSKDSLYTDFFLFDDMSDGAWPHNDSYVKWWDNKTLPKLNYASDSLREEILRIAAKWVSPPYNADGWRLDVAADLGMSPEQNHAFWKMFRAAVRQANPDALIIAEHYDDPAPWLGGDEWDSVMNYAAFFDPVGLFFTGMEKHADRQESGMYANGEAFARGLLYAGSRLPGPSEAVAMNQLSNHDHARFLTRTNHVAGRLAGMGSAAASEGVSVAVMRAAALFQMTWTGMPAIYYGDEAGLAGWTDPDNRRTYPWGHEDQELIHYHQILTYFRHTHPALMRGSVKILGAGEGWFAFGRFDMQESVIAVFSLDQPKQLRIPAWQTGIKKDTAFRRILLTDENSFTTNEEIFFQHDGDLIIDMPSTGAVLLESIK